MDFVLPPVIACGVPYDAVHAIVHDNGAGRSSEQLKHALDPFYSTRFDDSPIDQSIGKDFPYIIAESERPNGCLHERSKPCVN